MRKDWWTPLAGVAFLVVVILSFVVAGEPPEANEPVEEIVAHYVDNKDSIIAGAVLGGFAVLFLVFFGAIVRKTLATARGADSVLANVAFAGTIIIATGAGIDGTISFAIAESAEDIDPTAVQALQALWDNDFLPLAIGLAAFMLGSGLSIVRTGALPKWLGWVAILLGIAAITPVGFVAFLGAAVWVLIVSVMLTMRARAEGAPPAPAAPAAQL